MELFSVMVTGANRGIGLELVRQLAELNPSPKHIFATYRNKNYIQELKTIQDACHKRTKLHLIQLDVTNEADISEAVKIVGDVVEDVGLTLLINNAAVAKEENVLELTKDVLNFHIQTNTIGPLILTQKFYPLLKISAENNKSRDVSFSRAGILNISSMAGSITNVGFESIDLRVIPYKISKAALNMGMRVTAEKMIKDHIITIMMCPGAVRTDMSKSVENNQDIGKEMEANLDHTDYAYMGYKMVDPKESVDAILDTLSRLNETHNGTFMDRFGKPFPY